MGPGVSLQDPSALTTQQLIRENFWLRELLEEQLAKLEQRIDSGDQAVKLLQAFADRTPTTMDVQNQVAQLREVVMKMFEGIRDTFTEKDKALTAAFQAQEKQALATIDATKEASNKMESGFTKQIDMFGATNKTELKGIRDNIDDIKARITVIESKTSVSDPSTQISLAEVKRDLQRLTSTTDVSGGASAGKAMLWGLIVGGLGLIFGAATFIGYMMKFTK